MKAYTEIAINIAIWPKNKIHQKQSVHPLSSKGPYFTLSSSCSPIIIELSNPNNLDSPQDNPIANFPLLKVILTLINAILYILKNNIFSN